MTHWLSALGLSCWRRTRLPGWVGGEAGVRVWGTLTELELRQEGTRERRDQLFLDWLTRSQCHWDKAHCFFVNWHAFPRHADTAWKEMRDENEAGGEVTETLRVQEANNSILFSGEPSTGLITAGSWLQPCINNSKPAGLESGGRGGQTLQKQTGEGQIRTAGELLGRRRGKISLQSTRGGSAEFFSHFKFRCR